MTLPFGKRSHKWIAVVVVLFVAQLSCGNVSPADPNIPIALNGMVGVFAPLLRGLGVIPAVKNQPPLITQIQEGSISGLGIRAFPATNIRLYRVQLQGCGNAPLRGGLLAETTTNADGTWTIPFHLDPGEVVGATQVFEGKESGLSNLKANIDASQFLLLDNADEIRGRSFETFNSVTLAGTSLPQACVVLRNQDPQYGRVGSASAEAGGGWTIPMPIRDGENRMRLYVDGWEEIAVEFSILGFTPVMQWPYPDKNVKGYYAAPVTAFFGFNDFHSNPKNRVTRFHDGIDIAESANTPVHAVADGFVFYVQITRKTGDCGNAVLIDHGAWFTVYCHLSRITIRGATPPSASSFYDPPIQVRAGDVIGLTGCSGLSTSDGCPNHLHFSALRWNKGNLRDSLGSNRSPVWPWAFGSFMNINPPGNIPLHVITGAALDILSDPATVNSTDRLRKCVSHSNYWGSVWQYVLLRDYGTGSGTRFEVHGSEAACAQKP
jgi:murein DD-endopeptidase MepM/ murein hydrolase activator NlpD